MRTFKLSRAPGFVAKLTDVGGALPQPPGRGGVAVRRREESESSDGSHAAGAAHEAGPGGHHEPRLPTARDHHPPRRTQSAGGHGHRSMPAVSPPPGVPDVLAPPRPRVPAGVGPPPHPGQLRPAHASQSLALAGAAAALPLALHPPHQRRLAQPRGALIPRTHGATVAPRRVPQRAGLGSGH